MVACRWVTAFGLGLLCLSACGDDGGSGASQPDVADAGDDAALPDTGGETGPDLLQTGDGWIDGSYLDGREGPEPEHCTDAIDNDGDGLTNCEDDDCASRLICSEGLTGEAEPNNRAADGPLLELPLAVTGGIGEYTENDQGSRSEDSDWVRFSISAPTLVEWEMDDGNGTALPILTLVGVEEATGGVIRQLDNDTPGLIRQAYLPVAGTYGIEVRDRRNTSRDSDELPYGGPGYEYAFRLEAVDLQQQAEALPFESGPTELGTANELPVLALSLAAGEVFEAQLWAQRLAPSSGLDAMLYVVNTSGEVLAFSDDPPIGTRDPLLRTGILGEATDVLLVVDAFRVDFDNAYELAASMLEPSQDREPNDPIGLGFPSEAGVAIEGRIGAPFLRGSSTVRDADYYYFPGGLSAAYTVTVAASGGELDAAVRTGYLFIDSRGRQAFQELFQADPPESDGAAIQAVSFVDGPFFVEVSDRTNLFDREADPVGGEGFEYELTVVPHMREPEVVALPAAVSEELTEPGETDWFELTAPARTRLEIAAIEQVEGVEPFVYLAFPNDVLVQRGSRGFSYLNTAEQAYRVAVADRRGGGGDDYDYDLAVSAHAHTVITEVEPNDGPPVGGQSVEELPGWVDAEIAAGDGEEADRDVYVVNLAVGDYLIVETTFGANGELEDADPIVEITGPGLTEAVVDDDGGYGWFARAAVEAPEAGAYEVAVRAFCDDDGCRSGDYGVAFWIGEAPPEE